MPSNTMANEPDNGPKPMPMTPGEHDCNRGAQNALVGVHGDLADRASEGSHGVQLIAIQRCDVSCDGVSVVGGAAGGRERRPARRDVSGCTPSSPKPSRPTMAGSGTELGATGAVP